ncbi:hypothetical protein KEM55_006611 [Ascosphaera atra]|nr:hypothetical protein KEM55_006611 [Ascosphaera atra]
MEDEFGRPVSNGEPPFGNYGYGAAAAGAVPAGVMAAHHQAFPAAHPAMGGMHRGMEDDGMPASLAINRGPGTSVAAATMGHAGDELPMGSTAEQGYMGNHAAQNSDQSGYSGMMGAGGAGVARNNTSSTSRSLSREGSSSGAGGVAGGSRNSPPRRGPSNASSAYSNSGARHSDISEGVEGPYAAGNDSSMMSNPHDNRYSTYGPGGGYAQYETDFPSMAAHHTQPNPYGRAVDLHIPGTTMAASPGAAATAGPYSGYPSRAQSGGYDDYDYNDAYRGSQIYGGNRGNGGGTSTNF